MNFFSIDERPGHLNLARLPILACAQDQHVVRSAFNHKVYIFTLTLWCFFIFLYELCSSLMPMVVIDDDGGGGGDDKRIRPRPH